MSGLSLSAIYRYPIKSARGHALQQGEMDRFGLTGDRRWMVVDSTGRFVSQRSMSRLALLDVEARDGGLRLSWGSESCELEIPDARGERVIAKVWEDTVVAPVADPASNDWLSDCFGEPLRLVYCPDDALRGIEPGYAPPSQLLNFADGFPLLVISQESLDELNTRLPAPVPMDRFRPNLVISGASPHAEDRWRKLRVGTAELDLVKPCSRCAIPGIDQASAERDPHINRTLAAYRRRDGVIYFGMNALAATGSRFAVGDPVEVLDQA